MDIYHKYFSKGKPLSHYFHHFIFSNIILYFLFLIFGSITIWEMILFFFLTFALYIDNFIFALLSYLENSQCRMIINDFLVGDIINFFIFLHETRVKFTQLFLHNIFFFITIHFLWYFSLLIDNPFLFYGISGIIVHLFIDLVNDKYELNSIKLWFWPFSFLKLSK